jgi:hypothetical protein
MNRQNSTLRLPNGWVVDVASILTGVALLAIDALPLLLWAFVLARWDAVQEGPLDRSLVLGSFAVAVVLTALTVPFVHRWAHKSAARTQDTNPAG